MSLRDAQTMHVSDMLAVLTQDSVILLVSVTKGLITWRISARAEIMLRLYDELQPGLKY